MTARRHHIIPLRDMIKHEVADDSCVCGPYTRYFTDEGDVLRVPQVIHYSLDGREQEDTPLVLTHAGPCGGRIVRRDGAPFCLRCGKPALVPK
jgi:hypothetical protein